MLTVAKLLEAPEGLDPDANVVVGIINGPRFNAAYAQQEVCGKAIAFGPDHHELRGEEPALFICCYEQPRSWEGPNPTINDDGSETLEFDPDAPGDRPGGEG